jgi:hypothetical protein
MILELKNLTKNIDNINTKDILSCWQWCTPEIKEIIMISCLGDLFVKGVDDAIYWIATDTGSVSKIADNLQHFKLLLNDENKIDMWLLPQLIEKLRIAGKILKENDVYSYKELPVIGGEYSVNNIEPTDMSVHFAFSGQICEQIKDLPDGTKVKINFTK